MLAGQGKASYFLVRFLIFFVSYIGVACFIYFILAAAIGGERGVALPFSIFVESIALFEVLAFLFWFLPFRWHLQKPASLPARMTRAERNELFYKSLDLIPDIEIFVRKWTVVNDLEDLRRDDIKLWLLWALFERETSSPEWDEELDGYVTATEKALGRTLLPGRGKSQPLRLSFDPVPVTYRSPLWYMVRRL